MADSLEFSAKYNYEPKVSGIWIPVTLTSDHDKVSLPAKLDTGAHSCFFRNAVGRILKLDVEKGEKKDFGLANKSRVWTFGHLITLNTLGFEFQTMVYFFEDNMIDKNILGRFGWLDQIRMGVIDIESLFLLNKNE